MNRIARRTCLALCLPLLAAACGGGGGNGVAPVVAVFYIQASTPAINAQGAPRTPVVFVSFNKELDLSTVDDDTLTVGEVGGFGQFPGTTEVFLDGTNKTLRWSGTMILGEASTHIVAVNAALRSIDGDPLDAPTQYGFRTVGGPGPLVLPGPSNIRNTIGSLNTGRQGHEATRLANGFVLITGGFSISSNVTDSAEVFNTNLELFSELNNRMDVARASHTATLLNDGTVLITGGLIPGPSAGTVLSTNTAEIFNPSTLTFTPVANDMTTDRYDHAALLLPDGRVLITGGSVLIGSTFVDLDSSEIYDPATGQFTAGPQMVHTRATHVMLDTGQGRFILGGGSDVDLRTSQFNLATFQFEDLGQGAGEAARFGAAGDVFASGGASVSGGDNIGQVVYVFPNGLVQNTGSPTTFPRAYATATRYADDKILIAGGIDFTRGTGFIEASTDVIVEGGVGGSVTFAAPMRLPTGMAFHTATTLLNGDVLFCGGLNEDGSQPNKTNAFLFTP